MNAAESLFNKDIVLDEEAFDAAVEDFAELGTQLRKLRVDIEAMLELLESGFDTPAGRKFVRSCKDNLLTPLDEQKAVLEHISETLRQSRRKYSTVFTAYASLQTSICQAIP